MRKAYIIDTSTSVLLQEIPKTGVKVIKFYEGVLYKQYFEKSPLRKVCEKLSNSRLKYKNEGNGSMQKLVKLFLNSLCSENVRKILTVEYCCELEHGMNTENGERVID